ncbi:hypothetical protein LUZ60_009421 [Juncus effusus]|nr:hypothetical protein LUZ60_009421 [Juncus effusus]
MELKKASESGPNNSVGTKRENSDANNSTTNSRLVYVRRKIDHEQQSKQSVSNEILKNCGGEKEKVPISESGVQREEIREEIEPDLDLECHETNLDSDLCELKVITDPNGVNNKVGDSNLGPNGDKSELKLDVCTTSLSLNENVNDTKLDSELDISKVGTTNLSQVENKNEEIKLVTSNQVTNKDVNVPNLVVSSNRVTNNDEIDSNLGLDDKKNEPRSDTEPKLESQLDELQAGTSNLVSNQEKEDSDLGSNPVNVDWRERFVKLQIFLKDCDRSSQEDYIRMLRSLSAVGRSKHALDLEKRAMDLLMEEGKELRRMSYLNVLGREWPKDNAPVSTQINIQK